MVKVPAEGYGKLGPSLATYFSGQLAGCLKQQASHETCALQYRVHRNKKLQVCKRESKRGQNCKRGSLQDYTAADLLICGV